MKFVDEYRDASLARELSAALLREANPERSYTFMEFCGGHTHAIFRYGLLDLLPSAVEMVHGPGCPVCVLPVPRIEQAIDLAERPGVVLCAYGDMVRVPASGGRSLLQAKAAGADVRVIYSTADALEVARQEPEKEVVFLGIGFETTAPPTAFAIKEATDTGLRNFSVLCNHVLTAPAITHILDAQADPGAEGEPLDGIVGPAHVSTVIGTEGYKAVTARYQLPVVVAGFEPIDLLKAIWMLVRQVNEGRAEVENEYSRAAAPEGNRKAQALVRQVFETRSTFEWRGLGYIEASGLQIRGEYAAYDAECRFDLPERPGADNHGCECGAVLRGALRPDSCPLFGSPCTPQTPVGACMVSAEGACAAYYSYARHRSVDAMPSA